MTDRLLSGLALVNIFQILRSQEYSYPSPVMPLGGWRARSHSQISERSLSSMLDSNDTITLTKILDDVLSRYDKRIRPGYTNAKKQQPVTVNVSMRISSVSSISEVNMDFTVDMYFRQKWQDKRLAFRHYLEGREDELDESVSVAEEMLHRIWWPDTFFANAKKSEFHHATTKNAFLRIDSLGNVFHSLRLTVTAMCPMDLTYFPMDSQICTLEIESFGYATKDIRYQWDDLIKPLDVAEDVRLPQYVVKGKRRRIRVITLPTGNYSRLSAEFYFARSMGYYLIQIYIPSTLIVVLSWVSFWLSRQAVPARVALGITTVLTMTTLISSTNAALPKISYLKSIDVYLVTCFFMVFASLLEFAAVSYLEKQAANFKKKFESKEDADKRFTNMSSENNQRSPYISCNPAVQSAASLNDSQGRRCIVHALNRGLYPKDTSPLMPNESFRSQEHETSFIERDLDGRFFDQSYNLRQCTHRQTSQEDKHFQQSEPLLHNHSHSHVRNAQRQNLCNNKGAARIDQLSRLIFPLSFTIFNIVYWLVYLHFSDESDKLGREFQVIV